MMGHPAMSVGVELPPPLRGWWDSWVRCTRGWQKAPAPGYMP